MSHLVVLVASGDRGAWIDIRLTFSFIPTVGGREDGGLHVYIDYSQLPKTYS